MDDVDYGRIYDTTTPRLGTGAKYLSISCCCYCFCFEIRCTLDRCGERLNMRRSVSFRNMWFQPLAIWHSRVEMQHNRITYRINQQVRLKILIYMHMNIYIYKYAFLSRLSVPTTTTCLCLILIPRLYHRTFWSEKHRGSAPFSILTDPHAGSSSSAFSENFQDFLKTHHLSILH